LSLSVGQVVAVRAGLVNGVITANEIHADDSAVGPIDALATDGSWLEVLGQRVVLGSYTRMELDQSRDGDTTLRIGDVVQISGLRHLDGMINATLVRTAGPTATYSVAGWAVRAANNAFFCRPIAVTDRRRGAKWRRPAKGYRDR
jgi:hypothetical protein